MDPVSAFSLTCGVIQVIDFSTKAAKKCHELYRDGASSDNKEIEDMARYLTGLRTNLDLTDGGGVDNLLDLGSKCSTTAKELVAELEKMKVDGPHRKRQAVKKTFKAMLKRKAIDDIQKRLEEYRKLLDSTILVDLRKRSDLLSLQQNQRFDDLDLKVQTLIKSLAESSQTFDELKSLIVTENGALKDQITREFQQNRKDLAHKQSCERLLMSLWYPEIHRRQERVGEAHQNTFQWIYEPGGFDQSTCRWDSFVQWLKEGSGIYWIKGKAGSGKSTLMNYICQDDRTTDLLRTWSGTQGVFIPNFFFWNAGTTLERSSEGLLRSLLYQVLQRFPSLAPHSCQNQSALGAADESEHGCEQIAAWTERRLHATFDKVICQAQEICRICIFIDGLDETSEEPDAAIAVIKKLQSANTKICLSSRPDRSYTDAFESSAKLRLQDLTEPDIRRYIVDELQPYLPTDSEKEISKILDDVAWKAKGVFLWVELVVKALKNGLRNDDSLEQLRIRVDSMPSGMEALYAKMLSNIDIAYQEEGAQLFQIALANLTDSLLDMTLALSKGFERLSEFSLQDVLGLCKRSLWRIPVICAGLLEVHQEDRISEEGGSKIESFEFYAPLPCRSTPSLVKADISSFEMYTYVEFVHRTAMDFLRQSKQGRFFLEKNAKSCSSPRSTYVRALLAKVTLLGLPEIPYSTEANFMEENRLIAITNSRSWYDDWVDTPGYDIVNNIMRHVFWEEWNTAVAQVSLCDDVDRTLANVCQRYLDLSPDSPWFTRWTRIKGVSGPAPVPLWPRTSSQSSSQVPFRSARSEPMVLQNRQIDFPGFAVTWGLSRYVIAKFDLRQDHPDKEYVNYLLCCCVQAIEWSGHFFQPLEMLVQKFNLMNDLLSRGGNPNSYVESFSNTIWGQFLVSCSSWDPFRPCAQDLQIASATTAKAFLNAGADAGMKHVRRNHELISVHLASPSPDGRLEIHIQVHSEISVLNAVRISLAYLPEWKAVEEIILAKGGYEFYKYTHVTLYTPIAEGRLPYKISERQHEQLVTTLNVAHHDYLKQCRVTEWIPVLAEICRAHLASALDSDGQIASDDDASSDANAEEEFYESLNFQNSADVQDNHALE